MEWIKHNLAHILRLNSIRIRWRENVWILFYIASDSCVVCLPFAYPMTKILVTLVYCGREQLNMGNLSLSLNSLFISKLKPQYHIVTFGVILSSRLSFKADIWLTIYLETSFSYWCNVRLLRYVLIKTWSVVDLGERLP